jgi:hypothetical protein
MNFHRHGRACPGHPEMVCTAYRDARDKRGHEGAVLLVSNSQEIAR